MSKFTNNANSFGIVFFISNSMKKASGSHDAAHIWIIICFSFFSGKCLGEFSTSLYNRNDMNESKRAGETKSLFNLIVAVEYFLNAGTKSQTGSAFVSLLAPTTMMSDA